MVGVIWPSWMSSAFEDCPTWECLSSGQSQVRQPMKTCLAETHTGTGGPPNHLNAPSPQNHCRGFCIIMYCQRYSFRCCVGYLFHCFRWVKRLFNTAWLCNSLEAILQIRKDVRYLHMILDLVCFWIRKTTN